MTHWRTARLMSGGNHQPGLTTAQGGTRADSNIIQIVAPPKGSRISRRSVVAIQGDDAFIRMPCGAVSFIDAADAPMAALHAWYLNSKGYVFTTIRDGGAKAAFALHRLILPTDNDLSVDHIDRDQLNNRRSNLRLCTHQQNSANRSAQATASGYRGVRTVRGILTTRYRAECCCDGKKTKGLRRLSPEEAARDYDRMALEYFGPFAVLNFPVLP
jgi:hypothetical protein